MLDPERPELSLQAQGCIFFARSQLEVQEVVPASAGLYRIRPD